MDAIDYEAHLLFREAMERNAEERRRICEAATEKFRRKRERRRKVRGNLRDVGVALAVGLVIAAFLQTPWGTAILNFLSN